MTKADFSARLLGIATLGASWGVCLWLRELMPETPNEPTALQAVLVLASFALTLAGLLLILKGGKMLHWPGPARRDVRTYRPDTLSALSLIDERAARADALTRRALRASLEKKTRR
jgi:hypothetical protein